jgi:hypothetical protein
MGRRKAIVLPSSGKVYGHDDDSYVEHTLVALLDEASSIRLTDKDNIVTMCEYLPDDFPDDVDPTISDLKLKKEIIKYKDLKDTYKMSFGREYSPQSDEERRDFKLAVMEREGQRRAAWGNYAATMDYIRAVEEAQEEQRLEQEGDDEGLEKLRAKQNKRNRMLVIG